MANENADKVIDRELEPELEASEPVDYQGKFLRLQADMDNYRKRLDRNLAENVRHRKAEMLRGFLPVLDNLTRALEAGESSEAADLLEGVKLIAEQFSTVLENHGVSRIPQGGRFDPRLHEVLATVARDDVEEGSIVEELAVGYMLNGEVLRASGVRVVTGPVEAEEPMAGADDSSLDVKA
jgi:molecular chaperone GrpE